MAAVNGTAPQRVHSAFVGVALVSFGVLALEVILTRIFSFAIWYHFAYLALNVALLGFGASGSLLAVRPELARWRGEMGLALYSAAAALSFVAFLLFFAGHPLQPQTLFEQPLVFTGALLLLYTGVSVPFFFAGLAVASALTRYSERVSEVYFWDLCGAGLGALAALGLINWLGGPGAVLAASAVLLVAAAAFAWRVSRPASLTLAAGAVTLVILAPFLGPRIDIVPADSTLVAELYRKPEAFEILHREWNAINRIDIYRTRDPADSHAGWGHDGIQEGYAGPVPPVYYLVYDAHNGSDIYRFDGDLGALDFLDHHLLKTPYLLLERPEVLVIGSGGGIDVLNALKNGASVVTAVELQPAVVRQLRGPLSSWVGNLYQGGWPVELVAGEGRNFVERTDRRYDLVQLTATDTWAALNTGAYVLMESYLYTREAISSYLDRLKPGGVLCVVVWDLIKERGEYLQPINSRLVLQYLEILRERGISHPERHLAILGQREWYRNIFTLPVVKLTPFSDIEMARVRDFATRMGFEVLYDPVGSNVPNALSRLILASPRERERLIDESYYDIRPTEDDSPFFFNCYKWRNIFGDPRFRWDAPVSGQLVLLVMLGQSLVLGLLLIVAPLAISKRTRFSPRGSLPYLLYFAALGGGFMLLEVSLIQKFVLFLGYPAYAFGATLSALLVSSGIGSYLTRRVTAGEGRVLGLALATLAAIVGVHLTLLPVLFRELIGLALPVRVALAMVIQAPLGIVLGMFFPLGVQRVRRLDARMVPWMWAVNGACSVVSTVVAILLATAFGFATVSLTALAVYALGTAGLVWAPKKRNAEAGDRTSGGSAGAGDEVEAEKIVPIAHYMAPLGPVVAPSEGVVEAAQRMRQSNVRYLPVAEGGCLLGVLSMANLEEPQAAEGSAATAGQRMMTEMFVVEPQEPAERACQALLDLERGVVVVVENGKLLGAVTTTEASEALAAEAAAEQVRPQEVDLETRQIDGT